MIELKVVCDCGQKFKFDVEPVNGQMPFTVACPICKADGTAKANALLQQMTIFKMVEPPPASATAAAPIAPPPPAIAATGSAGGLRLGGSASASSTSHTPPPISSAPRLIAALQTAVSTQKITWYQYIWIGLPLVLIAIGGCIGGACGGAACAINRTVFLKTSNPVLKYVWTGMISIAAFVLWFVVVALLLGATNGLRQR